MKSKGGRLDLGRSWRPICTTPRPTVPGNKMAFPGIKDNAELADLLAYLRKLQTAAAAAAVGIALRAQHVMVHRSAQSAFVLGAGSRK